MNQGWSSGDQIVYREVVQEKVWTARPVTVIQDDPDLVALYFRNGTRWKVCVPLDADTDLLQCKANLSPWKLEDAVWARGDMIFVISPGEAHAVHVMWDKEHRFAGWYVNLQEPLRRTAIGFDFLDQELDLVVTPDLAWRWKDMDHLQWGQRIGLYSEEQAQRILEEGRKVVRKVQARAAPFDGSWNNWTAPVHWEIPSLHVRWSQVD
jgi:hypothetical protein